MSVKLQLLKLPRCHVCIEVQRILSEEIIPLFPDIEIETIDMTSERGQKMLLDHKADTSPVLFIEGELFSEGPVDKHELIAQLQKIETEEEKT